MTEHTARCSYPDCEESYQNHLWGKIKAGDRGWFFTKSGEAFCPEHVPDWVKDWRAKRKGGK